MAAFNGNKYHKKYFNKSKPVQLYKQKTSKRDTFVQEVQQLRERYEQIDTTFFETLKTFEQLPLSSQTLKGLKENKYVELTDIQRESIGLALIGYDILGAAKTGSGKTLAFVIPVLECLFRAGWSRPNGLGSLVITPTRELAYQIFKVFNKVGKFHNLAVALVIGGKDLKIERTAFDQYNIVICTPGRLLQHMNETTLFDALNLKILVLDEADRILDMGFEKAMNAIIENLPKERQTLLFSATQTKSIRDIARLSLSKPKFVSVYDHNKFITPESLTQSYLVCEAHDKINFLWSFLKRHKKQKILVFMASCKQVKYVFEAFCRMKPGLSVTALYGSLHQLKRLEKYRAFCDKQHVVMFATDIAARGLDFPHVNWVLQLDCPENVSTYIHRAGRTARYQEGGESLLVLLPSERDSMVKQIEARKIPITEIKVNPKELTSVTKKLATICSRDLELSQSARRACTAYLKSIFLMKDKTVFDVQKINMAAYARSQGLLTAPRTRFITKQLKNKSKPHPPLDTSANDSENKNQQILDSSVKDPQITDSGSRSLQALDTSVKDSEITDSDSRSLQALDTSVKDSESENINGEWFLLDELQDNVLHDFRTHEIDVKKIDVEISTKKPITKFALAKKILKKETKVNSKIVFDEEGEAVSGLNKPKALIIYENGNKVQDKPYDFEEVMNMIVQLDKIDKKLNQEKIKEQHRVKKMKLKKLRQERDLREDDEPSEDNAEDISTYRKENSKQYIKELPDPDKYFGKDSENSDDDDDDDMEKFVPESLSESVESKDSESDDDDDDMQKSVSAKLSEHKQPKQKRKRNEKKQTESSRKRLMLSKELPSTIRPTLALDGDEEFALNLLQRS